MKYSFSSRVENCQWTESMRYLAQKQLAKSEKFLNDEAVKLHLEEDGESILLKVQARTRSNKIIRAEARGSASGFASLLSEAASSICQQAKKSKEKLVNKRNTSLTDALIKETSEAIDAIIPGIVKHTTVIASVMTEDEAIDELEASGYTWYIFRNIENNEKLCIINKRLEGNYKLINIE